MQLGPAADNATTLLVEVTDDGPGFDLAVPAAGLGLVSMRERSERLGGQLSIESTPGSGTGRRAVLPPRARGARMTTGAAARIRVFAVDDHAVVRVGLRAFLDVVPDVELVGDAPDGLSALAQLQRMADHGHSPDVVLMDLVMRGMDGIEAIAEIRRRFPTVEVIVVTGFGEVHRVQAALGAGAAGYVLKDADVDEIVLAIRAAHRGQVHLDRDVTRTLTQALVAPQRTSVALTAREREVLVHVSRGRSNREISRALSIGERTVQTHLGNVLTKLGLHSRTQAALWAAREGLVDL